MDVEYPSLAKFTSTEATKFWVFMLKLGDLDCHLLRMSKLPLCPMVGGTPITPIRTEELPRGDLASTYQSPGAVLPLTVRLICLGSRISCALLRVAARCVCGKFCHQRRRELKRRRSRSCNPIVNPRVNFRGEDQEGPVTQ